MNRARRTPHTRLRTRLGAGMGAALTTALVASGAGLAAPATAAPTAPSTTAGNDRGLDGLLELVANALSGSGLVGSPLSLLSNPFINNLVTVTKVEWLRDGMVIPDAGGTTYTPGAADVGREIRARVSGLLLLVPVQGLTQAIMVQDADSGAGDELVATVLPQITGIPGVGSLLQVLDPVWSLPGVSTTYQWFADGAAIPGATGQTFVPGLEQAGTTIYVQVTGLLAGLPLVSVLTNHLPIPAAPAEQLGATSQPEVSGIPKVGKALTVSDPVWNTDGVTHGYQWLRDGAPIEDATLAAYELTPADLGHAVSVTVTGTKEGWTSATVDSNALTTTIGDAIVATLQPRVTGTAALGQALSATPGTWGAGETPVVAYQWLRDGTPVIGATASSYAVTVADLGRDLALRVTATRTGYAPGTFTTAALPVARATTSTTATAARKKIRQGRAAVLTITVDAAPASPDGKVAITEGGRTLKTFSIAKGSKKVRIKKLAKGKHTLRVGYLGSETTADSRARKVVVRVLRKKK